MGELEALMRLTKLPQEAAEALLTRYDNDLIKALQSMAERDEAWYEAANRHIWELVEDYVTSSR